MNARSPRLAPVALAAVTLLGSSAFAQDTRRANPPRPPATPAPAAPAPSPPPATAPTTTATAPTTKPSVARSDLPAAKDIVNQCIDAMGGEKAFDAIQSSLVKASMTTPMGNLELEMSWMKPNKVFIKQQMAASDSTMGSDGSVSWMKGPAGYQIIPPEQARQMQEQSNMFRMVLHMRDDSKELKTVDQLKFNDADCYKVSTLDKEDHEQFAFFDVKDHLIRGIEATQDSPMGQVTSTVKFSEWKQDAGIKYFTKVDIEQMGMTMTLTFDEVKFNTLEPSVFALPEEVKNMLKGQEGPPTTTNPATPTTKPTTRPAVGGG